MSCARYFRGGRVADSGCLELRDRRSSALGPFRHVSATAAKEDGSEEQTRFIHGMAMGRTVSITFPATQEAGVQVSRGGKTTGEHSRAQGNGPASKKAEFED